MTNVHRPGPPGPPPDEHEDRERDDQPFRPPDQTEPDEEPTPESITGRPTVSEDYAQMRERIAAQAAQNEQMRREIEFLARAQMQGGAQAQPQADPVVESMRLLQVDPQTWNRMIADPQYGAEQASNGLQGAYQLGVHTARVEMQQLQNQMAQHVAQQSAQTNIAREGDDMKRKFWEQNQGLLPYERLVRQFATEVAGEVNQGRAYTSEQVLSEIGARTRSELRSNYGIELDEPRRQSARVSSMTGARERLRPAGAEMGSGLGRRSQPMSNVQKQLYRLARRG